MVLLIISVVLVPLVGKLCREIALPLIVVDLVPRVGGFGHQNFSGSHKGQARAPFRVSHAQAGAKPHRNPAHGLSSNVFMALGSGAVAQTLVLCVETAT